ncbi:MAG: ABC transporter permease [Candidatus Rokubacteria bacterium]|nr:ABC transporter permease [Candidatus Rokubacteria bacterium]
MLAAPAAAPPGAPAAASADGAPLSTQPRTLRKLLSHRGAVVGAIITALVLLAAALAPVVSPDDPYAIDPNRRLMPPAWLDGGQWSYPLGTDHVGRDILSRIIHGSRISTIVGLSAVAISATLGVSLGLLAGFYGGAAERIILFFADVQIAFPFYLLAISIIAAVGSGFGTIIVVFGVAGWVIYARIVRGTVLSLREREFVEAARALGGGHRRIILRHVLPNILTPVIILATLRVASVIVWESGLSFLGLSVPPPTPTWGRMLAEGRGYLANAWWAATFPGLAIMVTVLGVNMLGDGLRDALDPRLELTGK